MLFDKFIRKSIGEKQEELKGQLQDRPESGPWSEQVQMVADVPYLEADDGKDSHRMDVFRPKNVGGLLPVVINLHGGGLVMGDRRQNRAFCSWVSAQGFLVFGVDYPLATDQDLFGILNDVSRALDKVDEYLNIYGGDRTRVYLVGDSAGAWLCMYTAALQKSEKAAEAAGITPTILPVHAMGFQSGMFYVRRPDKHGIFLLSNLFFGNGLRRKLFRRYTDPEHAEIIRNLPPCYLITSGKDYLKSYSMDYFSALQRNGKESVIADYENSSRLEHAFAALYPEWPESEEANRAMLEYLLQFHA